VSFLFPVTNSSEKSYYNQNVYTAKIIQIERTVVKRGHWVVNHSLNRIVCRKHPEIQNGDEEYFFTIRKMLPVVRFYCYRLDKLVYISYCLIKCRWSDKTRCRLFINREWGCLDCSKKLTCVSNTKNSCVSKLNVVRVVSLYFSELLKRLQVVYIMRFGRGYRKNFKGIGPQLYKAVGRMPPSWHLNVSKNKLPSHLLRRIRNLKRQKRRSLRRLKRRLD